ncbi:MAG: transglutaminase [Myxococcales bacterium 68-20]|nr:transglutaminase family protein [Myxococcales bacterium]OJY30671.1 MAG: transglutaminase [Myxococcales bacterium 68-20]
MSRRHLRATALLDYEDEGIQSLIERRGWRALDPYERIGAAYAFVRDEIAFGYNETDSLPASRVLADGYGQCNTKATLLMALLRALGIPSRLHGATIHKRLQKGVVTGLFYVIAPTSIFHTWVEVSVEGRWVGLEGVILDAAYLQGLRSSVASDTTCFLGFGVGTENLAQPPIEWRGTDTFIQSTGVNADFGVYDDPDGFYAEHGNNLSGFRAWLYARWIRHVLNRNVARIRARGGDAALAAMCCSPKATA